jgi:hypothetical protein
MTMRCELHRQARELIEFIIIWIKFRGRPSTSRS